MPGCWSNRRVNATPRSRSIPVTTSFVLAPGHSWNWVRRNAQQILSVWMRARSGRRTSCRPPSARREGFGSARGGEAHADDAALSPRSAGVLFAVAASGGSGPDRAGSGNQFAHRTRPRDVVLPGSAVRVLRQETSARSIYYRARSSRIIAPTRICSPIRCSQNSAQNQPLTKC